MTRSISVRSAEKGPSQLLGGELSGLGQGRSKEGRMVESDDYFEGVVVELTDLCVMSLLVTCHPPTATSHMSAAPSLHTCVPPNSLASSCFRHSRCLCSRRFSAASLVPAVQRMGPARCLPVPGAAAGDRRAQVRGECALPSAPAEPSAIAGPHLIRSSTQCRLLLLSRQQYHRVGLAFPSVARPAPAGRVRAAAAPLSPTRLLTTARTGWWPQKVPKGGFSIAGSCPRAGL